MIQSESESVVGLVVVISIIVALGLLQVRNVRHDRRLRRLYAEADIRMVGGPFDGATLDPVRGGHEWPPKSAVVFTLRRKITSSRTSMCERTMWITTSRRRSPR